MRAGAVILLSLVGCQTVPSLNRRFTAPPDKIADALLSVLQEDGDVERAGNVFKTHWRPDEAVRRAWKGPGSVFSAESRYRVVLEGDQVRVEARSRVFVRRGALRRDWEDVDPAPAAERLLQRLEARLR